jgi:hypothetical protein
LHDGSIALVLDIFPFTSGFSKTLNNCVSGCLLSVYVLVENNYCFDWEEDIHIICGVVEDFVRGEVDWKYRGFLYLVMR